MPGPKVLLFDLGGVIVNWRGFHILGDMAGLTRDQVAEKFAASPIPAAYEKGLCEDDEFAEAMVDIFGLSMTLKDFKHAWNSWVGPVYPGTREALLDLKSRYTTACLSNINNLHWTDLPKHLDVTEVFHYQFASHEIQAAKPHPKSYAIPIEKLGVGPSDIWFFDDTHENVIAAREAGLRTFHVDRSVGVIPILKDLDLI